MKTIFIILNLVFLCLHAESQITDQNKTLRGHEATVLSLDIDNSGKYLVSGSYDTDLILWDYLTGNQLKIFKGHISGVWNVKISPDSKYIASGSRDNNLNAKGSSKNCLNILDLKTLKLIKSLSIYPDRYKYQAFIPELDRYAVNGISDISFNMDASKVAAISRSGDLFIWDIQNDFKSTVYNYSDEKYSIRALSNHWDYVACIEKKRSMIDSTFYLMALETEEIIAEFDEPKRAVIEIHFSSNTKYIATSSGDRIKRNEIDIWDIQTTELLFTLIGHSDVVRSIEFSNNDKYLASAGEDNIINLWDIQTGKLMVSFTEDNDKELTSVIFSPDQKKLISASQDKTIKYWSIENWIGK